MSGTYPVLSRATALRQIGSGLHYRVNARSGDYYELDADQLQILRNAEGTRSLADLSKTLGIDRQDAAFFNQLDDGLIELLSEPLDEARPVHYRRSEPPHLSDVLIEITGFCNLSCAHCFNAGFNEPSAIARQMSTEQLLRLIAELDDMNVRRIQHSGGEPLLRSDLWSVIEAIDEHRMFLDVISTNATAVAARNVQRFARRFAEHGALTMAARTNLHEMDALYDWMAGHSSVMGWRIGLPKVLGRYREFNELLELEFSEVIAVFKRLLQRWMADRPSFRLELSDFFRTDSFEAGLEDHQPDDNPCKYSLVNMTIKPDGTAVFCASLENHEPAVLGNVTSRPSWVMSCARASARCGMAHGTWRSARRGSPI